MGKRGVNFFMLTLSLIFGAPRRPQEMCFVCFDTLLAHFSGDGLPPPSYANYLW